MTVTSTAPLTGSELLTYIKQNSDLGKTDLVTRAGYFSTGKDGKIRTNFTAFYEAAAEASGIKIGGSTTDKGKGGRKLSYTAKVHGNGSILIGKAYTGLWDLQPGDEFDIKLSKQTGTIRLIPVGSSDAESVEE